MLYEDTDGKWGHSRFAGDEVFNKVVNSVGYSTADISSTLRKLRENLNSRNINIAGIAYQLKITLKDFEVLYLPTYRRIELSLAPEKAAIKLRSRRSKSRPLSNALYSGDIQFGLSDIAERLSDLNQSIIYDSLFGYQQISADIINEMVGGQFDPDSIAVQDIPERKELEIFFSRLKEGGRRVGPFQGVSVPNLDKIYEKDEVPSDTNKFLKYFLNKLYTVIKTTREVELPVEAFVEKCNKYLSNEDLSTRIRSMSSTSPSRNIDSKKLRLNRKNLEVFVEVIPAKRALKLDALSSGEKQMISLFAKLFLYPKQKLVLIDEPELSLSIDWQRQILVDILDSSFCRQVIAITHSPFVFDNALDPFARALDIEIKATPASSLDLEDEFGSDE